MIGQGRVVEKSGAFAYVLCVRESACGKNCVHCKLCEQKGVKVLAENKAGAEIGDIVTVFTNTGKIMFLSFMLYVLPVILFFVSVAAGSLVLKSEGASIIFIAISFFIWFIIIKILGKKEVKHTISEVIYHRD